MSQSFASAIREFLQFITNFVLDITHTSETLLSLWNKFSNLFKRISLLATVCMWQVHNAAEGEEPDIFEIDENEQVPVSLRIKTFPRGAKLVTHLYEYLLQITPGIDEAFVQPFLFYFFSRACEPYFAALYSWIYNGSIIETMTSDFFVAKNDFVLKKL